MTHLQIASNWLRERVLAAKAGFATLVVFAGGILFAATPQLPPKLPQPENASGAFAIGQYRHLLVKAGHTPVPDGHKRDYEGLPYLLALLHCDGEFQILNPPQPKP